MRQQLHYLTFLLLRLTLPPDSRSPPAYLPAESLLFLTSRFRTVWPFQACSYLPAGELLLLLWAQGALYPSMSRVIPMPGSHSMWSRRNVVI